MIEEILNIIRRGPDLINQANANVMAHKSVARGAHDSTLQFPILVSDTIPIDMANTISRTLERAYAGFVQTWLSMNQTVDLSIDPTPMSYLKKFHQNVKLESTLEELTIERSEIPDYMDRVYAGEYQLFMNEDKTYGLLFNTTNSGCKAIMEENRELLKEHLQDFNLKPVGGSNFFEADSDFSNAGDLAIAMLKNAEKDHEIKNQKDISDFYDKRKPANLIDRDVKKSNDMMPFALQVRLVGLNKDKQFAQYIDFILGIKAVMHPIRSDDMIEQISQSLKNRDPFFKFLRWTSGEISLVRNLILNMDELKMDATASRKSSRSPWFSKLRRLKGRKFTTRNLSVPTKLIPNTTIVVSEYEVNSINKKFGMDLRDPSTAKKLINDLFLMGFVIEDEGTNTIDIMYDDNSNDFQTFTLEALQREVSLTSNKLGREIGRMIQHN